MDIYIFSNTKFLDFRTLICPKDPNITQLCEEILQEKDIQKSETVSSFVLFSKIKDEKIFVGAIFDANKLDELSYRYFFVDRCSGETPTKVSLIFVIDQKEGVVLITKSILTEILRRAFSRSWYETRYLPPISSEIHIVQDISEFSPKQSFLKKNTYKNLDEMIFRFNSELLNSYSRDKVNLVYYLEPEDRFRSKISTRIIF